MEWTNGMWTFSGESKKRIGHPAPFPVELPRRCIKLFSYIGDTVLDPFAGSGTSLLACKQTNRNGIGVEIDEQYCTLAKERILQKSK
jgi:site-specific DNA-methyltransferase (adenine-specific)